MNLQIFEKAEFGSIRSMTIDNTAWVVGKDICQAFGDKNHNRSLGRVDDEDKREEIIIDSLGRKQTAVLINESGLYSLLFSMQPQKANNDGATNAYPIEVRERIEKLHKFKHWVTSEVLPTIRKTGGYVSNEDMFINTYLPFADEQTKMLFKSTLETVKELNSKIEADKPKVLFADAVETAQTSILIGDLAKLIKQNGVDIGQKRLFSWLRENGYLIKNGISRNMPTQKAMELKLFEVKERTINNPDGSVRITKTTKVTGKGQSYFINKFLAS